MPLNENGCKQAEATGARVARTWQPRSVYASPLARAVRTAEAIAGHFGLEVQINPGLVDIDYGDWQGLSPEEARQQWPEEIENWYQHPERARIPNGESLEDLRTRARKMLADVVQRHPDETIVLVGHTVINRIILLEVLGLGNARFWRLKQDTCAINVFETVENDFTLVTLNDVAHLG